MATLIVTATRLPWERLVKESWLYQSLLKPFSIDARNPVTQEHQNIIILSNNSGDGGFVVTENKEGLPAVYNRAMAYGKAKQFEQVIFAHDDVRIEDNRLFGKLREAWRNFDIIGLAGTSAYKLDERKYGLWHVCSNEKDWSGAVAHPDASDSSQLIMTSFGPMPKPCVVLDGAFLAVNRKTMESDWRFNEHYDFHFYDIASCIDAHRKGLKLGTWPIWCIHQSPGLSDINDQVFLKNKEQFCKEYKGIHLRV